MRTDKGLLSFAYIFLFKKAMTSLTFIAFLLYRYIDICVRKYGINFLHRFINYHTQ
jgi:hypothetical protein